MKAVQRVAAGEVVVWQPGELKKSRAAEALRRVAMARRQS